MYNIFWACWYLVGLQFTHFKQGAFRNFKLEWGAMKEFSCILWALFIFCMVYFASIFLYVSCLYYHLGLEKYYGGGAVIVAVVLGVVSYIVRKTHGFHCHHYMSGIFVIVMIGY